MHFTSPKRLVDWSLDEPMLRPFLKLGSVHIRFSFSTFLGVVLLLPVLMSPSTLHLSYGRPSFRCPFLPSSLLSMSSVFLSTWPNHLSLTSLMFSLMFATPAIALVSSLLIHYLPIIHHLITNSKRYHSCSCRGLEQNIFIYQLLLRFML